MSNKAYLIKRIEELEAKKKALEESEKPVEKTSDPEPADMPEPEKSPMGPAEIPASLEGFHALDLHLMFIDGQMDEVEKDWYRKRSMLDTGILTPLSWMG